MGMHPLMTRPGIGVPFAVAQIDVGAQSCGLFSFKMFGHLKQFLTEVGAVDFHWTEQEGS